MRRNRLLIVAIILMAIGFATVTTNLIINGSTTIGNNIDDLNVYFSKTIENGIVNNSLIKDNTHISFNVDLVNVDDVYELKYEVTNASRNYDLDITIDVTEGNEYIGITNDFDTKTLLSRTKREGKLTIKLKKAVTEATTYQVKVEMTAEVAERTSLGTDELNYVNLTGLSLNGTGKTVSGKEFTIELTDSENMLTYYVTNSSREYDVNTTITCEGAGLTIENHFENKILNGNTVREGKLKVTGSGTLKCTITTGLPISRDTLASEEITEELNTDEIEPFPKDEPFSKAGTLMERNVNKAIWEYGDYITKVVFEDQINPYETDEDLIFDMSESKNGSVMAYLVKNGNSNKYTAYIQSETGVKANADSSYLFSGFSSLKEIEGLEYFDTSNVTKMKYMFADCKNLEKLNLESWNTGNVTTMREMFVYCTKLTNLDISSWNTSSVTDMYRMFYECTNLTTLNLSSWNTSNVTNMSHMFYECRNLTNLYLGRVDINNNASKNYMFLGPPPTIKIHIKDNATKTWILKIASSYNDEWNDDNFILES